MSLFDLKIAWNPLPFLSKRTRIQSVFFVISALIISINTFGNTITVTNTNSSGAGSLDQAIQDFVSGGTSSTIAFDASLIGSTITITQAYSFSGNTLVIDGDVNGDGTADITLQSDGTNHRFFSLSGTAAITLKNLQVENFSNTSDGGVIQISTGTVTIENCLVRNNTGRSGGVIHIENGFGTGDANISKSIFSGNSATSFGGVIYQASFLSSIHTVIENSLFFNNSAPNSNGGVAYISDGANFTLRHVTLSNNSSKFSGGAISNNNNLTIENSLIVGNSSESGSSNIQNNRTFNNAGGSVVGGQNGASDAVADYFVDATNGNYNLISTSQAVSAGLNSLATAAGITTDIVGNAVPYDGIVDIADAGAYEFQGDPPIHFESSSAINSNTMTLTLTFDRHITGLDNSDFSTKASKLSLTSLTTPDNVVYTATFNLADQSAKAIDTVFMNAMVQDLFSNMAHVKDTFAYVFYVPVARVTNTQTSGEGSFDQALQDFVDSQGTVNRVEFDPSLNGSTIMVTQSYTFSQGTLTIDGDIDDDGAIDVTLQSDGANHGFFIINGSTSLNLSRVQITDFSPSNQWGPVVQVNSGSASLSVEGCEIRNISTGGFGGAVYCENGSVSIKQSIFDNSSALWGGAVTIYGGTTSIENSLFINNTASNGGAIYGRNGANITVRHCTFSGNSATSTGGAIHNLRVLTVENSLFVNNTVNSTVSNITNQATLNDNGGNKMGGEGAVSNVVTDYFVDAANKNFRLHGRSLAADEGVNLLATNAGITTDLLGNTRPFAGTVQKVDVGAYELQADPDFVAPTVSLATTSSSPTNHSTIPVSITFTETVTGFTSGDVTVSGGTVTNFTGSLANYSFDLVPSGDGALTVDVGPNVAMDAANNGNTAATQLNITYDGTHPTVNLATTSSSPTNNNTIPVSITFTETVTGFNSGDVTVSGGTVTNFTGSAANYSFDLFASGDGELTVDVGADVATDAAGNGNTVATQLSVTYDGTSPAINLASTSPSPTNNSTIPVSITFTETVIGFNSGDMTVSGGTVTNFVGSGANYSFDLMANGDGTLTVDVGANAATDVVGNSNTAANQLSLTYDGTQPTVSLATTTSSPTNKSTIPVTITFSEPVTGFESSVLTVSGGTVTNFTGSSTSYSFDLVATADGTITVDVGSNSVADAAGNGNIAATQLSITYDGTKPTVSLATTSSSPTDKSTIPVTISFSESVTGFESGDVTVSGGTVANFTGSGTNYSFDLVASGGGGLTVDVGSNVASDAVGNGNTSATQLSVVYDDTKPTVSLATTSSSPTNNSTIPVTITFSESVTGFESGDVTVSGGSISNFTGSGTSYSLDLVASGEGTLTVDIGSNVATDVASNGNSAAAQLSVTYDSKRPTISLATTSTSPTNGSTIPVTITFSESVTGFESNDLTVSGGTISNFTGSSTSYSLDLVASGEGTLTVDVGPDVATDAASNGNTAAAQLSVAFDSTKPTVSLATISSSPTDKSTIPVTITFSESVTGFESGDVTVSGGTIANFTGSAASYSFDLVASADGILTVDLRSNVATDAAGNGNTVATQFSIVHDVTAPTVSLATTSSSPTKESTIPVTITFSESVTGFESGDVTVSGGTIANFSGSATSYSFDLVTSADGMLTVDVGSNVATDAAGNGNTAATQFTVVHDATAPTVSLAATSSSPTNNSTIPVNILFSESVAGFESGDVTVSGGTISNFTGAGTSYSFDLLASEDGTLTVDIGSNVASDASGHGNGAAATLSVTYDGTAPVVTVDKLQTMDQTPGITGTIDDPTAAIEVTVNGEIVNAVNNTDGTWIIEDNILSEIDYGTHDINVVAVDAAQNVGRDDTENELTIHAILAVENPHFELNIYPNPVADQLSISGNFRPQEIRVIEVLDAKGSLMNIQHHEGKLNVRQLPDGLYFLRVQVGGKILIRRFKKH